MPYDTLEKIYSSLTLEKQKEAYDFICYLYEKSARQKKVSPEKSDSILTLKGIFKDSGSDAKIKESRMEEKYGV